MAQPSAPPVVLIADDEPQMLELVARHLKSLEQPRLEIIEASDGDEAWRLAKERLPDLVVLDVMMPGMSGWEVCRKIREDVALAHTGVVMLTGIGESLNEMTSPLYGADAYIDKPFEFERLERVIAGLVGSG
jgi:DNA-binding response OmpR family regulator